MFHEAQPLDERRQILEDLCFHPDVQCIVKSPTMVVVGIPGQEALCTIVTTMNHRVKHPIACIKTGGVYTLVAFVFGEAIYGLKGPRGGEGELDLFAPIVKLLELDLGVETLAYGYRGSIIIQTGFDELTLQIDSTPILRMHHGRLKPAGAVKTLSRGLPFYVTMPAANSPEEFEEFAQAITPSFVAVSWNSELKRREALREA